MLWEQGEHHVVNAEQRDEEQSGANESPAEGSRRSQRLTGRGNSDINEETGESYL